MSYARILGGTAAVSGGLYAYYRFRDSGQQNSLLTVNAAENVAVVRPNVPLPSRTVHTNSLKYTPEFDVLVIGGGATGCGVALDAITRGMDIFRNYTLSCPVSLYNLPRLVKAVKAQSKHLSTFVFFLRS